MKITIITFIFIIIVIWSFSMYRDPKPMSYVALWDSYTIGEGISESERWPNILVSRLKMSKKEVNLVANPSVTGYTTLDLIEHELPLIDQYHPDFITLQIGVNDYFRWVTISEFRMRYAYVLEEIRRRAPEARVLILDIPDYGKTPLGKKTGDPMTIESGLRAYNQAIRELAKPYGIPVIDIFSVSLLVSWDLSLVASDGLHPSAKQYALWVDAIYPIADKIF